MRKPSPRHSSKWTRNTVVGRAMPGASVACASSSAHRRAPFCLSLPLERLRARARAFPFALEVWALSRFPLSRCGCAALARLQRGQIGPDQLLVGEALSDDFAHDRNEAASIGALASIEPEHLLVEIAEQME